MNAMASYSSQCCVIINTACFEKSSHALLPTGVKQVPDRESALHRSDPEHAAALLSDSQV